MLLSEQLDFLAHPFFLVIERFLLGHEAILKSKVLREHFLLFEAARGREGRPRRAAPTASRWSVSTPPVRACVTRPDGSPSSGPLSHRWFRGPDDGLPSG